MILREPMLRTVKVFAIVAPERKIDFDPAGFTSHNLKLPNGWIFHYFSLLILAPHIMSSRG